MTDTRRKKLQQRLLPPQAVYELLQSPEESATLVDMRTFSEQKAGTAPVAALEATKPVSFGQTGGIKVICYDLSDKPTNPAGVNTGSAYRPPQVHHRTNLGGFFTS